MCICNIPLSNADVGVVVGTPCRRETAGELSIAQSWKGRSDAGYQKGHGQAWPCVLPSHSSNQDVDAGANGRTNT
jgi:hypothetical protein